MLDLNLTPDQGLERNTVVCADALDYLRGLPDGYAHCLITSPPYFNVRDFGVAGQIGQERSLAEYVSRLTAVFAEALRVLRADGVMWINMGDCYSTHRPGQTAQRAFAKSTINGRTRYADNEGKRASGQYRNSQLAEKNLLGVPWRLAFALQDIGWILRSDIIWEKAAPKPESSKDRVTRAHEYVFMFVKNERYYYDYFVLQEPAVGARHGSQANSKYFSLASQYTGLDNIQPTLTRNARSVWRIASQPTAFDHYAAFPPRLVERLVSAGSPRQSCAACGAPYVRVVEREFVQQGDVSEARARRDAPGNKPLYAGDNRKGPRGYTRYMSRGFRPSCRCGGARCCPASCSTHLWGRAPRRSWRGRLGGTSWAAIYRPNTLASRWNDWLGPTRCPSWRSRWPVC